MSPPHCRDYTLHVLRCKQQCHRSHCRDHTLHVLWSKQRCHRPIAGTTHYTCCGVSNSVTAPLQGLHTTSVVAKETMSPPHCRDYTLHVLWCKQQCHRPIVGTTHYTCCVVSNNVTAPLQGIHTTRVMV